MPENKAITSGDDGGRGQCALRDLMDPHRARGTAGLIAQAITYGYLDAFCIDYQETKRLAQELARNESPRLKAAGLKLLTAMALHDLKLLEVIDKSDRLDNGQPTDRVEEVQYIQGVDPSKL
jgi:hypothetical protein